MRTNGTPTNRFYAGIGSRSTPEPILVLMTVIARIAGDQGMTLRSGGAQGADRAFEDAALAYGHPTEIFLPNDGVGQWADQTVRDFHPAPDRLAGTYVWKLMARNAKQVLGANGDQPVERVICWTPGGKGGGGTGQAIRIAQQHGIPVHDLGSARYYTQYLQHAVAAGFSFSQ